MTSCSPTVPELQPVGPAVAAGPLVHNVGHDDAVMVGGEHRGLAGCPGEVEAVDPKVAREGHVGEVADAPGF